MRWLSAKVQDTLRTGFYVELRGAVIGFSYVNMDEGYNGRRTCYFAILFEVELKESIWVLGEMNRIGWNLT